MESKTWLEPSGLSQALITRLGSCLVTSGASRNCIPGPGPARHRCTGDVHGMSGGCVPRGIPAPCGVLVFLISPIPPSSKVVDRGEVWSFTEKLTGPWRD